MRLLATQPALVAEIQRGGVGPPPCLGDSPQDGWSEPWLPVLRERCKALMSGSPELGEETKRQMATVCRSLGP
ncbi:MAG: hypothetical protein ACRELA_04755 [Candidatus Rokuibacteriota bacterium]